MYSTLKNGRFGLWSLPPWVRRLANVKRWVDDILPLLDDDDPLGGDDFATHRVPIDEAPRAYEMFQKKEDGAIKVVLSP